MSRGTSCVWRRLEARLPQAVSLCQPQGDAGHSPLSPFRADTKWYEAGVHASMELFSRPLTKSGHEILDRSRPVEGTDLSVPTRRGDRLCGCLGQPRVPKARGPNEFFSAGTI